MMNNLLKVLDAFFSRFASQDYDKQASIANYACIASVLLACLALVVILTLDVPIKVGVEAIIMGINDDSIEVEFSNSYLQKNRINITNTECGIVINNDKDTRLTGIIEKLITPNSNSAIRCIVKHNSMLGQKSFVLNQVVFLDFSVARFQLKKMLLHKTIS